MIIEQYYSTVRPMHNKYVKTTKKYADLVVPGDKENLAVIDILRSKIMALTQNKVETSPSL